MHMRYVAGLLFDEAGEGLVLIKKNRPDWQRGKLNAVGGKVETGEHAWDAMHREFVEETGAATPAWKHFANVQGGWGTVHFFKAFDDEAFRNVHTETDEEIVTVWRDDNWEHRRYYKIPCLNWLIPLALDNDNYYATSTYRAQG